MAMEPFTAMSRAQSQSSGIRMHDVLLSQEEENEYVAYVDYYSIDDRLNGFSCRAWF